MSIHSLPPYIGGKKNKNLRGHDEYICYICGYRCSVDHLAPGEILKCPQCGARLVRMDQYRF